MIKLVLLLSTLFLSSEFAQKGDYLCWVSNIKDPTCGTRGWSKHKNVAIQKAFALCDQYCESVCKLDYCEKIK